jgi:hypothetical protein
MSDQLYLSLWFPNFRFEALPAALVAVMRQFALVSKNKRVSSAAAYPVSFSEPAVYQRVYVVDPRAEESADTSASIIENAVAECAELLHEDTAYELEMKWPLWTPEAAPGFDTAWKLVPTTVRFLGFGPEFDDATFEQNGHIRVDFGLDTPWVFDDSDDSDDDAMTEDEESRDEAAKHIKENVEMLLAFTLSVEKHCGISSRLLWTESGEPLAEKLIARLQRLN